jgi:spore coat protein U domain-containing protein, fimbrial subunit CupE1/2/3/6
MSNSENCQNRPTHRAITCVAAVIALIGATAALASTFTSQSTLAATCTVTSAPALNFGNQQIPATDVDATSTIQVRCTKATPYNIGLDAGTGSDAAVAARKMTSGGAAVIYSLYSDSVHTAVWGDTIGTDTVAATGAGSTRSHTVYGHLPAQSTHAAGTYTDTITVTVTY